MKIIHIFGSSGSGTTTLARAICQRYGFHLIDIDDVFWCPTDPPFTVKRDVSERIKIIENRLKQHDNVVISGAFVGWGDVFISRLDLAVYLHLPTDVRVERIKHRESHRFGDRVKPGGDLYQQHLDFLEWVKQYDNGDETTRSRKQHLEWMKQLTCPIVSIEAVLSIDELILTLKPYLETE